MKKKKEINKGGILVEGRAFYVGKDSYNCPTGIIVDTVKKN